MTVTSSFMLIFIPFPFLKDRQFVIAPSWLRVFVVSLRLCNLLTGFIRNYFVDYVHKVPILLHRRLQRDSQTLLPSYSSAATT